MGRDNPDCNIKPAARVDSYRGFVFASLAADGPGLTEFLGGARIAFDDMCDRSPEGEVEIVPTCFRINLVNSPSTMVKSDDLENFWKAPQGLACDGGDWVNFQRHHGSDLRKDGWVESAPDMGTSEAPMRNQMQAWVKFMTKE